MTQQLTPEQEYAGKVFLEWIEGKRTRGELQRAIDTVDGDEAAAYLKGIDPVSIEQWDTTWPDRTENFGREFMTAGQFKKEYAQSDDDWVFETLLPRGEVVALVGARGEGKTFLGLGAGIAASQGEDFGPFRTGGKGRHVLYITEEALGGVAKRIENYQQRFGINEYNINQTFFLQARVHQLVESNGGREPVIKVHDLYQMICAAQERGEIPKQIDLIVLDYFRRSIIDANENDNGHVAKAMSGLYDLAEALNCGIMVIHHKGKNKDGGPRGASVFGDFVYACLVTEGGDLGLREENLEGDLVFVEMEEETNLLSASGAGGKQPKDGKLDDYRYCLVKQRHNTIVFVDQGLLMHHNLDSHLSKLAKELKAYLMARPGQPISRQVVGTDLGLNNSTQSANLSRAWKEIEDHASFVASKQGREVSYCYAGTLV